MCFCLSGYMIDWWTHRRSLAFSFIALYPVFPGQDTACFVDFLWVFFSDISERLSSALTFSPLTLLDLLGSPFGDFFFFFPSLIACSPVCISTLPFPLLSFSFSSPLLLFPVSLWVFFGLCSPHPQWFSSLMDSLSTHRQPHATPA